MTILILEDQKIIAKLYQKSLEKAGYQVIYSPNTKDAFQQFNKQKPQIILADHGLSGDQMTGIEFISKIKKNHHKPPVSSFQTTATFNSKKPPKKPAQTTSLSNSTPHLKHF